MFAIFWDTVAAGSYEELFFDTTDVMVAKFKA